MSIEVIYENSDYVVLNKPSGLMVHPDGKSDEYTLCDFLLERYPDIKDVGESIQKDGVEIKRPGIVHRLDKETSGVMIAALNQESFKYFKNLFKNREVKKTYNAFVWGNIKEDEGVIDQPIGRSKKDFRRWFAGEKARGKLRDALTEYKILKRGEDKEITFVEVYPKTGRTHQIRVHFKHIYRPLVGDTLYCDRGYTLGFNRLALHAKSISLTAQNGEEVEYVAEYPADFHKALDSFK
jgi:23S rRNA pseudouridine1911/1915/1917 synthase